MSGPMAQWSGACLKHPGRLGKEAAENLAQSWRETHSGPAGAGKVAVLEEGMTFDKIGVSPEDAELLDSRRFSVEELCRVFGVPPPIIGEWTHATFSNTAQRPRVVRRSDALAVGEQGRARIQPGRLQHR